jgi:hypothetical protein
VRFIYHTPELAAVWDGNVRRRLGHTMFVRLFVELVTHDRGGLQDTPGHFHLISSSLRFSVSETQHVIVS